jgi:hypothetical protein
MGMRALIFSPGSKPKHCVKLDGLNSLNVNATLSIVLRHIKQSSRGHVLESNNLQAKRKEANAARVAKQTKSKSSVKCLGLRRVVQPGSEAAHSNSSSIMGNHGDQFNYYNVTAKDPGPLLLYITLFVSVALYALLPCMVAACANRRLQYLQEREEMLQEATASKEQEEQHAQQQIKQKANSRENASSSGICDAQPGKPATTIPNAWKHTSRLLNSRKLGLLQTSIQSVAKATHKAHDAKRTGMQKLLIHLERTDNPHEDGDGVMIDDAPLPKEQQPQDISGIFSYNAMKEVHVPVVRTSAIVGGGSGNDNYDDDYGDQIPPHNLGVNEMSPIHPCRRTYITCRNICKWDTESRRILKLALPYVYQALVMGVAEAGRVGILASLYDTRSMSAYVICVMLIGFTADFFGGILDSQGTK